MVHPREGERYYLRRLLYYVRGPTSFDDILKYDGDSFDGELCPTFKAVCQRIGLLKDDKEWELCLQEAAEIQQPRQLRRLFCEILIHSEPANPLALWNKFKADLCNDILHHNRELVSDPSLQLDEDMEHTVLRQLNTILEAMSSADSLATYGLPIPPVEGPDMSNNYMSEVLQARDYDKNELSRCAATALSTMTNEQKTIFHSARSSNN